MTFEFNGYTKELDNTDVDVLKKFEDCLVTFYYQVAHINMKQQSLSQIYSAH